MTFSIPSEEENVAKISYGDLAEIDLDLLASYSDDSLYTYFVELANLATDGQLKQVLGYGIQHDEARESLIKKFAERKHSTALKLRGLTRC